MNAILNKYKRVPLSDIVLNRDDRQRREIEVDDLLDSISRNGVLVPIIITEDNVLVAGERRYTASLKLGLSDIPVRYMRSLSIEEQRIVELEENIKRSELPWQDEVEALLCLHELFLRRAGEEQIPWIIKDTAREVAQDEHQVGRKLKVARELRAGNKRVITAQGFRAAFNVIERENERKLQTVVADLHENLGSAMESIQLDPVLSTPGEAPAPTRIAPAPAQSPALPPKVESPIICEDFIKFSREYDGQTFNFLHCDFPYGINHQDSDQGRAEQYGGYQDDPGVYWDLCAALCDNLPRILSPSSHIMFWFSMKFYHETLSFFARHAPVIDFNPVPLIWYKSDNRGILADPKRGPRNVYEVALMGSIGDKHIVKAVSNCYAAPSPSDKTHQSEKSEPMLKYFFQMFVDNTSRVLDPTCGSGSALRAADALRAERLLGLERNPEFAESAREEFRKYKILRSATS